jgi:hypothetical protein
MLLVCSRRAFAVKGGLVVSGKFHRDDDWGDGAEQYYLGNLVLLFERIALLPVSVGYRSPYTISHTCCSFRRKYFGKG